MTERKITLIYCPEGVDRPCWAALGYAKQGPKNIHFRWLNRETNTPEDSITLFNKQHCIIIEGWHEEVVRQVEDWKKADREHWQKRRDYQNELERKLREIVWREIENWDKQNPPPKFIYKVSGGF